MIHVADRRNVFHTTNAGVTWIPVLGTASNHSRGGGQVFFVNDTTFFVFSRPPLRTTDGGTTFTTLSDVAPSYRAKGATSHASPVFFLDASHGWGIGEDAVVVTTDGGQRWQTFEMSIGIERPAEISMFDEQHGLGRGIGQLVRTERGYHRRRDP